MPLYLIFCGFRWLKPWGNHLEAYIVRLIRTKLERLTICSCGAPVLHDDIKVGTEYIVFPATELDDGYYRCGRCGREQLDIRVIDVIPVSSPHTPPMPLPRDLFPADLEAERSAAT